MLPGHHPGVSLMLTGRWGGWGFPPGPTLDSVTGRFEAWLAGGSRIGTRRRAERGGVGIVADVDVEPLGRGNRSQGSGDDEERETGDGVVRGVRFAKMPEPIRTCSVRTTA